MAKYVYRLLYVVEGSNTLMKMMKKKNQKGVPTLISLGIWTKFII